MISSRTGRYHLVVEAVAHTVDSVVAQTDSLPGRNLAAAFDSRTEELHLLQSTGLVVTINDEGETIDSYELKNVPVNIIDAEWINDAWYIAGFDGKGQLVIMQAYLESTHGTPLVRNVVPMLSQASPMTVGLSVLGNRLLLYQQRPPFQMVIFDRSGRRVPVEELQRQRYLAELRSQLDGDAEWVAVDPFVASECLVQFLVDTKSARRIALVGGPNGRISRHTLISRDPAARGE